MYGTIAATSGVSDAAALRHGSHGGRLQHLAHLLAGHSLQRTPPPRWDRAFRAPPPPGRVSALAHIVPSAVGGSTLLRASAGRGDEKRERSASDKPAPVPLLSPATTTDNAAPAFSVGIAASTSEASPGPPAARARRRAWHAPPRRRARASPPLSSPVKSARIAPADALRTRDEQRAAASLCLSFGHRAEERGGGGLVLGVSVLAGCEPEVSARGFVEGLDECSRRARRVRALERRANRGGQLGERRRERGGALRRGGALFCAHRRGQTLVVDVRRAEPPR